MLKKKNADFEKKIQDLEKVKAEKAKALNGTETKQYK